MGNSQKCLRQPEKYLLAFHKEKKKHIRLHSRVQAPLRLLCRLGSIRIQRCDKCSLDGEFRLREWSCLGSIRAQTSCNHIRQSRDPRQQSHRRDNTQTPWFRSCIPLCQVPENRTLTSLVRKHLAYHISCPFGCKVLPRPALCCLGSIRRLKSSSTPLDLVREQGGEGLCSNPTGSLCRERSWRTPDNFPPRLFSHRPDSNHFPAVESKDFLGTVCTYLRPQQCNYGALIKWRVVSFRVLI